MSLRAQHWRQQREIDKVNGDVPVADRGYEDKDNDKEGIEDDVRWVHGKSGGRVFVFMEDIEGDVDIVDADVDAHESGADTGRAVGGMVTASSSPRSFPLSLSRSR